MLTTSTEPNGSRTDVEAGATAVDTPDVGGKARSRHPRQDLPRISSSMSKRTVMPQNPSSILPSWEILTIDPVVRAGAAQHIHLSCTPQESHTSTLVWFHGLGDTAQVAVLSRILGLTACSRDGRVCSTSCRHKSHTLKFYFRQPPAGL